MIQNGPKESKSFKNLPEASKSLQKRIKASKSIQKLPKASKSVQKRKKPPKDSIGLQKASKSVHKLFTKMIWSQKIFFNYFCFSLKIVQNGLKWSKIVKNDQQQSKSVQKSFFCQYLIVKIKIKIQRLALIGLALFTL